MRSNSKVFRSLGMLTLVAALALVAGGCGGGGKKSSSGGSTGNGGKTYPLLRVAFDAPDYMDPGLYYTVSRVPDRQLRLDRAVWVTALVRAASAELVPYLAENMPTVSADGKNLKFKLRANLKYSNGAAGEGE